MQKKKDEEEERQIRALETKEQRRNRWKNIKSEPVKEIIEEEIVTEEEVKEESIAPIK